MLDMPVVKIFLSVDGTPCAMKVARTPTPYPPGYQMQVTFVPGAVKDRSENVKEGTPITTMK
ncbi:hypothetical protein [Brevibacillus sp. NRS-1366]|uniref:hypothetical protein n=1 Tax=Brevibacillus sp. NRS-1366 TaxID=3233899 RepID=UPI003D21EC1C